MLMFGSSDVAYESGLFRYLSEGALCTCDFNRSLQHRLQISLLVSCIARSFLAARLAGVRQRLVWLG